MFISAVPMKVSRNDWQVSIVEELQPKTVMV
jgi:hypothetical protein